MRQKKLDDETRKKIRQYGKHARWTIKVTKGIPMASQELIEAVKKKDSIFLAAEEEAKEQVKRLRGEEKERKKAERKAIREKAKELEEEKLAREENRVEEEKRKTLVEEEKRLAGIAQEKREKGERLERAMEIVATRVMRPPMSSQERQLLNSLELEQKQKVLLEIAVSWGVKYGELAKYLGISEGNEGMFVGGKEKKE